MEANTTPSATGTYDTTPLYLSDADGDEFTAQHRAWLARIMAEPMQPLQGLDRGRSDASLPGHIRTRHNLRRGGFRY